MLFQVQGEGITLEEPKNKIGSIQYLALAYNLMEAFFAVLFGQIAQSIALTGFGFNSLAEFGVGLLVIKRLKSPNATGIPLPKPPVLMAILFFAGGSYVLFRSLKMLLLHIIPAVSWPGIVIAVISLLITPLFALWSFKGHTPTGRLAILGFQNIWAYLFLSLGLLLGLVLRNWAGIWQADPVIGLVTAAFLYKKSLDGLLGGALAVSD